jgi:hypothetical protein
LTTETAREKARSSKVAAKKLLCSIFLISRSTVNALDERRSGESGDPPLWISAFIDSFHPMDVSPRFVEMRCAAF